MNTSLFNRYGIALLDLSISNNNVEEIRDEIKEVKSLIKSNKDFVTILYWKEISNSEKYEIIDKVFKSCSSSVRSFIKVIIKNNLSFYLYDILKETNYRFDDYLLIETGTIYSAAELNEEDILKISKAIERKIYKKIELKQVIDNSLIGGFKVVIKNGVYDASIITKYNSLRAKLIEEE